MPGERYRHFKNRLYQVITVATHSETGEAYVVYQALYGDFQTYVRPYDMFVSRVDHRKYPEVLQEYRFEYLGDSAKTQQLEQTEKTGKRDNGEPPTELKEQIPAGLLAFLDAERYSDKLEIVIAMGEKLDDHLINQMAASMDVIIEDGPLDQRIEQLLYCIRTRAQYELRR
jgi:hypothetical protein